MNFNVIIVSNKVSFGKRYFIGYKDAKKLRHLRIYLPRMISYGRYFDETKYEFFEKR